MAIDTIGPKRIGLPVLFGWKSGVRFNALPDMAITDALVSRRLRVDFGMPWLPVPKKIELTEEDKIKRKESSTGRIYYAGTNV